MYLYPREALIAPGTNTGEPWDGFGTLPPNVRNGLRRGVESALRVRVMRQWLGRGAGAAVAVAADLIPWAADTLTSQTSAPDTRLSVRLNGRPIGATGRASRNTYNPTWSVSVGPVVVDHGAVLDISATDRDIAFHDHIGVCHLRGPLMVTDRGYVSPDTIDCHGGLWGVLVEVQEGARGR